MGGGSRRDAGGLGARGQGDRRPAADDFLGLLGLRPHLELDEVHVVLGRLCEDSTPARHDVFQPDERREADGELADRAGPAQSVSAWATKPVESMPWANTPDIPAARANSSS